MCVLRCRRRREGLSNALPQYSQGNIVLSLGFFTTIDVTGAGLLIGSGDSAFSGDGRLPFVCATETNFDLMLFILLWRMEFCGDSVNDPNDDLDFIDRSSDPVSDGFWFSFCDDMDNDDEEDRDEAEDGDATKDIDRSNGLSVCDKTTFNQIFL